MHQWIVSDRIWVCFLREIGIIRADLGAVVALHQELHEVNKTKRLFFEPIFRCRD